ncbi:esterase/lipase family protein [Dokdonella sp. MW10]|uniref:esterase/lipase family protein n=1 Tax=Dokdonella sp. MW10 TaxID=2992926 RepID=UPI003F7E74DE
MAAKLVVFVHGWGVTDTATYGALPARLISEAGRTGGPALDVRHVHLAQYVSFRDEVRVEDLARAFDAAITRVLAEAGPGRRFVCITHSTGGPVVREWLHRFHLRTGRADACPMSHLVMLAPANFGSALAQLGKGRLAALKSWFSGIEPGQGVLDWLELGSPEACALNSEWIDTSPKLRLTGGAAPVMLFVLSGGTIDRKLYDHINAYTGENGSDGVVRLAAANLNATHVVLEQPAPDPAEPLPTARKRLRELRVASTTRAVRSAFKILPGMAHSGDACGIMRSVRDDGAPHVTVEAILRCLAVEDAAGYASLCAAFERENAVEQAVGNRLEVERVPVLPDRTYIHDPHAMVIFRLLDPLGRSPDVNLLLTAGPQADPNQLPSGFLVDRQANRRSGALTFHLNHAVLAGSEAIPGRRDGEIARPALVPRPPYGLRVEPREQERFVEYWTCALDAAMTDLLPWIAPNETTIVDIHLQRIVREGVLRTTRKLGARDFRRDEPGGVV